MEDMKELSWMNTLPSSGLHGVGMMLCVFIPLSDLVPKHTLRKMTICLSDCRHDCGTQVDEAQIRQPFIIQMPILSQHLFCGQPQIGGSMLICSPRSVLPDLL
jgi:hypothetical protein